MAFHLTKTEVLYSFVFYSILGWFIDSLARTIVDMQWTTNNALGVPFSPVYGLGALGYLALYPFVRQWKLWEQLVVYSALSACYEYASGVISVWFLHRRLWDYTDIPFNIHGHTDPFHAVIWGLLAILVTHRLQPWIHERIRQRRAR